jgi:endogenous inhibitor of DNA gyrase (YacG/DUF329 family)
MDYSNCALKGAKKMLKINCDMCHEEVTVNMHISNPAIHFQRDGFNDRICYTARAKGRAICPRCGAEITKQFESEIFPSDVIELALRREHQI